MRLTHEVDLTQVGPEGVVRQKSRVAREVPLAVLVNGKAAATLHCTPDKLEHLAVGFLLSEGIIKKDTVITGITLEEKDWSVRVDLEEDSPLSKIAVPNGTVCEGSSGAVSFQRAFEARGCFPLRNSLSASKEKIFSMMEQFLVMSDLHRETHGVHSAALCSPERIEIFVDDIGRHNAIDKIMGECFLEKIPTEEKIILTTGRVSSEILIKIARQKVPVIVARAVPTDMAVDLARRLNITIVGAVRDSRMNIYSHEYRII